MSTQILLVDRELGFVWALSQELRRHGVDAIPSHSVPEAQSLLAAIQPDLSVVLIDCRCPGACDFAAELQRENPAVRIIGSVSGQRTCARCSYRFSAVWRPEDRMPERIAHCADIIRMLARDTVQIPS